MFAFQLTTYLGSAVRLDVELNKVILSGLLGITSLPSNDESRGKTRPVTWPFSDGYPSQGLD